VSGWCEGASAFVEHGPSFASADDVDGDRFGDILVGVPGAGTSVAGGAYLVYGGKHLSAVIDLTLMNATQGVVFVGANADDWTARRRRRQWRSSSDFIIRGQGLAAQYGAAYVVFGHSSMPSEANLAALSSSQGVMLRGTTLLVTSQLGRLAPAM
jgi:hypothetical protein